MSDEQSQMIEANAPALDPDEPIGERPPLVTWDSVSPRVPDEDKAMMRDFMEFLWSRYANRPFKSFEQIKRLQDEAETRFREELGMVVTVTITPMAQHVLGGNPVALVFGRDYRYIDDQLLIRSAFKPDPIIWMPTVVLQDYCDIDVKKVKAETAIWERERRRNIGDDYWGRGSSAPRKINIGSSK